MGADCLAASAMSQLTQVCHVKGSTDPSYHAVYTVICILRAPSWLHKSISSGIYILRFPRKVQGIRNNDQSLSPVTSFFTFSVIPNPLKCSGTFLILYTVVNLIDSYIL